MAEKVNLIAVPWNGEAERLLERAIGNNPTYTVQELRAEVENRTSMLLSVVAGDQRLGYIAVFFEGFGGGRELVLQCGAALQNDTAALARAMPAFRDLARSGGATSIRAHMGDKARVRMFEKFGFKLAEYVVRTGV